MAENLTSDRNLLIALLAFQNNFIDRPALLAAFAAWTEDKSQPIAELLVEQNKLTTPQRQLIEALATEHLKQHHNDPQQSLAALSSVEIGRAALEEIKDNDLQQSLVYLRRSEQSESRPAYDSQTTLSYSLGANTSAGQRFRILRPHAEGGLGKVSVARDEELNREVALKEIKPKFADEPSARARFILEAEITGGLEHPGIVPVYGLGTYADGRPFYAMRFIRGDSLKDAIDAHFQDYKPTNHKDGEDIKLPAAAYQSFEFRQLLVTFINVCYAIAYAHARGVLHRDLKPGNIMRGKYGETMVVDWGLAKVTGKPDPSVETSQAPLTASNSSDSSSGSAETIAGDAIGTIGYMSPEQAAGQVDQFGPATDIYLLGATLYHILTGHPPHRGKDQGLLLRQIREQPIHNPRQANAAIPAQLAAICLKSMTTQPAERYESVLTLTDDIEHWLADEPVSAYSDNTHEKIRRTIRKRPTLVTALATAIFAIIVLLLVISIGTSAFFRQSNMQLSTTNRLILRNQAYSDLQLMLAEMRHTIATAKHASDVPIIEEDSELAFWRNELRSEAMALEDDFDRYRRIYRSDRHFRGSHEESVVTRFELLITKLIELKRGGDDGLVKDPIRLAQLSDEIAEAASLLRMFPHMPFPVGGAMNRFGS